MSTAASNVATWLRPTEVLGYATAYQIEPYLGPLRGLVDRLFPVRDALKVYVDQDPELRDVRAIVFDVQVTGLDLPQLRAAETAWGRGLAGICPAPPAHHFVLLVDAKQVYTLGLPPRVLANAATTP
jgi:hypothetical protein